MRVEIWQPRWRDRTVLIAKFKVSGRSTEIVFTKAPSIGSQPFVVSNEKIINCPIESNGKINCYAVPLDVILDAEGS